MDIVTSGDTAWHALHERSAEPYASFGRRCLVIGNGDDDEQYITSLGDTLADAESCDYVLARSAFVLLSDSTPVRIDDSGDILSHPALKKALETAAARGVPLVVSNPGEAKNRIPDCRVPGRV